MTVITSVLAERRAERRSIHTQPPRDEPSPTWSLWPPSPPVLLAVATLVGILLLGLFSVLTIPAKAVATVWSPAAGLALGLGIRTPRRYLWLASVAVVLVIFYVNVAYFRSWPLTVAVSAAAGLEMAIGTLILRWGGKETPTLVTHRDLARLLFAVIVAATAYPLTLSITTLATGDAATALLHLFSAGPRRAAGMLLVAPLFMRLPTLGRRAQPRQTAIQLVAALMVTALVFLPSGSYLPLAFLAFLPPVWGALFMEPRWLLVKMLAISTIASYGSATGNGPFSFVRFGPTVGGTLLQVFEITMVTVVMILSLAVARERAATTRLGASELVYRRNFETSLAGILVVVRTESSWQVQRYNQAAAALLPELADGVGELAGLLGNEAASRVASAADQKPPSQTGFEVLLADGRHFQAGIASLDLWDGDGTFALQVLDITDSVQAQQQADEELERAGEVQRALMPAELPCRPGWAHGAAAVPAREVGGDFYDLRIAGRFAVMSLGDVMGKGVGAGILATATRTALRSFNPDCRPADALADTVRIIEDDLRRTNAFVTLGYAVIDLMSGAVRLADAGHGLTFIVRSERREIERVVTRDLPIGLGSEWSEINVALAPSDSLLMVSDGVLDQWGGSIEQLLAAITQLCADESVGTPQQLAAALCRGAADAGIPGDDATAVVFRREASSS